MAYVYISDLQPTSGASTQADALEVQAMALERLAVGMEAVQNPAAPAVRAEAQRLRRSIAAIRSDLPQPTSTAIKVGVAAAIVGAAAGAYMYFSKRQKETS